MRRSSEFPLFLQTAIALFSFLLLITLLSSVIAPKGSFQSSSTTLNKAESLRASAGG